MVISLNNLTTLAMCENILLTVSDLSIKVAKVHQIREFVRPSNALAESQNTDAENTASSWKCWTL